MPGPDEPLSPGGATQAVCLLGPAHEPGQQAPQRTPGPSPGETKNSFVPAGLGCSGQRRSRHLLFVYRESLPAAANPIIECTQALARRDDIPSLSDDSPSLFDDSPATSDHRLAHSHPGKQTWLVAPPHAGSQDAALLNTIEPITLVNIKSSKRSNDAAYQRTRRELRYSYS